MTLISRCSTREILILYAFFFAKMLSFACSRDNELNMLICILIKKKKKEERAMLCDEKANRIIFFIIMYQFHGGHTTELIITLHYLILTI